MRIKFFSRALLASAVVYLVLTFAHRVGGQPAPRRIEVTASRFEFAPGEITVKKGEPVVLALKSVDVPHGLRFRELGIETRASKGQTSELSFTPSQTGDFVGHCSVFCGSGHGKMQLTIHVVE